MITREMLLGAMIISFAAIPLAWANSSDVARIRTLESRLAAAAEARNLDAIMKAHISDETLFVFDVIPPRHTSAPRPSARIGKYFSATPRGHLSTTPTDVEVTTVGTIDYGHSIQRIVATSVKGDQIDLTTRVTDVYRKIKDNWVIVREHISVPVDLDSGKPDFSSKP